MGQLDFISSNYVKLLVNNNQEHLENSEAVLENSEAVLAFKYALEEGHAIVIKELLLRRPDLHLQVTDSEGNNGLHQACIKGDLCSVENIIKLLGNSTHLDATNSKGQTCFHLSAKHGHYQIFESLLIHARSISIDLLPDSEGFCPLAYLVQHEYNASAIFLVNPWSKILRLYKNLSKIQGNIVANEKNGDFLMHLAVRYQNINAMHALASSEKLVNPPNQRNVTPLHLCAQMGLVDCAQILVDYCKKYKEPLCPKDIDGLSPLHYLAIYPRSEGYLLLKILGIEAMDFQDVQDILALCEQNGCTKLYNEILKELE